MAILYATTGFFQMISDIGLVPSVINTDRDKDEKFLQTIWTIQVIRSAIIGAVVLIAAYPISIFYEQEILFPLMVIAGITAFASGFISIAPILEQKYLRHKTRVLTSVGAQIISACTMALIAFYTRSIWALIAGYSFSVLLNIAFSYIFFDSHFSKFRMEKEAVGEIVKFGRWIFLSTIFAYICNKSDVLILGQNITMEQLGIYSIAIIFSNMIVKIPNQFAPKLLHPLYKKIYDESSDFSQVHKRRFQFNLIFCSFGVLLAVFGNWIIELLYDDRYSEAGWMLQMLALGKIGTFLTGSLKPLLMALKQSFELMIYQIIYAFVLITLMLVGLILAGTEGIIIGAACVPLVCHPVMLALARRHYFRCARQDLSIIAMCVTMIVTGWWLVNAPISVILSQIGLF